MNILGVKVGNFSTTEIQTNANSTITPHNERIVNICKSCEHALSLDLTGYHVTADGKLYQGWWDNVQPHKVEDKFRYDKCCQWMKENIQGAKFLYVLTAFWGCDHTTFYVLEYENGTYRFTENTYAVT